MQIGTTTIANDSECNYTVRGILQDAFVDGRGLIDFVPPQAREGSDNGNKDSEDENSDKSLDEL
jgi:hypothetical protein